MRILLTNDDGVTAPGIQALAEALCEFAEVFVVAPVYEQSGSSQSITVFHPIRVDAYPMKDSRIKAWGVGGTPADCVKIGLAKLLEEAPDFVVSGINRGANLGTDVLYSGTVSAAREGAMNDIPSIAVSLEQGKETDFSQAVEFMKMFMPMIAKQSLHRQLLLNINVPCEWKFSPGNFRFTKLGTRKYKNAFEKRLDPYGRSYYWMGGMPADTPNDYDTDVFAVRSGTVAITPIHFDLTDQKLLNELKRMSWQS